MFALLRAQGRAPVLPVTLILVGMVLVIAAGACGSDDSGGGAGPGGSGGTGDGGSGGDGPSCGDLACANGEDCDSCPSDCGLCGQISCSGGLTCGELSCCAIAVVPGGTLKRGRGLGGDDACPCDLTCSKNEEDEHDVNVEGFWLDRLEVTVGRFRAFVQAGAPAPAPGAGAHPFVAETGWDATWDAHVFSGDDLSARLACDAGFHTWTQSPAGLEDRPINCVTWFEAFSFCVWDGGRLPSESEWEMAASGGTNRLYPWGSEPPAANRAAYDCRLGGAQCDLQDIVSVGTLPRGAGRYTHLDLAGNVLEWAFDWFSMDGYSGLPCDSCVAYAGGTQRVIRGGSFAHTETRLRSAARDDLEPSQRSSYVGFRCARDR